MWSKFFILMLFCSHLGVCKTKNNTNTSTSTRTSTSTTTSTISTTTTFSSFWRRKNSTDDDLAPKTPLRRKRQEDQSISNIQTPFRNINLEYLLSNPGKLGPNENCYYQNDTIYENDQPHAMTEQEKSQLDNFANKMDLWSKQVQLTAENWLSLLFNGEMFQNNNSVPPWPGMPQIPCFCKNC